MKLPLLGIMFVVLVQLGYTAYNAVDRPLESLVAVNAVTKGTNPVAVSNLDDEFAYQGVGTSRRTSQYYVRQREPVEEAVFVPSKRISAEKPIVASGLVAMQRPFETITITYRPPDPGGERENSYTRSTRPTEGRSLASKSVAVVRKPYDWLKTLGSKLR